MNTKAMDATTILAPAEKRKTFEDDVLGWGELVIPEKSANPAKTQEGLRTLVVGSAGPGMLVLDSLKRFEQKYPEKMNLLALITDMPTSSKANISAEKRIWRFFTPEEKQLLYRTIQETALSFGIPTYSGAVKCNFFRELLFAWRPEIILMCCYGQLIDAAIFNYPDYGMYNLHPSDLASTIGIGTQPVEHAVSLGLSSSRVTFHKVNEIMDGGAIIGKSPPINIKQADGSYSGNMMTLYEKVCSVCGWMAVDLIRAVLEKRSQGEKARLDSLDFEKDMPDNIKHLLMDPVKENTAEKYTLPWHGSLI
jgi:folate-dependent phosphoribosylglycinamide formyltransferase PurN